MTDVIRSRDNPLVKRIVRLVEQGRYRRDEGTGIAEGWHLIRALLEAPAFGVEALQAIMLSEGALDHSATHAMQPQLSGVPLHVIDARVFARFGEGEGPNAAIGLFALPGAEDVAPVVSKGGLQLWLDAVQDPGNVGTLIRTAAAAGATAVVLGPGCADPWAPRVLRAGMGGQFAIHVLAAPIDAHLASAFPGRVVAMERYGGESLFTATLGNDLAVLLGNEGAGLSSAVAALAGSRITIPMSGRVESLNVAAAGAVVAFEHLRRRQADGDVAQF